MAIQYIIDLNSNDQLPEVIRKCNHNFKITNLEQRRSGTISSDVEEEITDITAAIANEQAERIQGDSDLSDRIDNIPQYTLPPATANTLGGIMVGNNLSIDQNGVLSTTDGVPDGGTTGQVLAKASNADQDTEWVDYIPTYIQSSAPDTNSTYPAASIMPCFVYYPVNNSFYYCVDAGGGHMTATKIN